jgi:protease-4
MFNIEKMMKNKLGVTTDTYKTGPFGDFGSMMRPMTESEKAIMQVEVDRIYNVFADRVSKGRKMTVADVDSIGQGRVWTGESAKSIGLVDTLGGLDVAIAIAARKAKISDFRISNLPKKKEFIEVLMEDLKSEAKLKFLGSELPALPNLLHSIDRSLRSNGIKAFSPYTVRFD